ncbi:hypothetical protein HPC49_17135 [Pyxidicoccus fallax]|uniref:RCC1-like domain-containing protein n=1 Tax=Pyxidicoccus fallax TaxID=394095 RepID=A0A848LYD2_9BACT|nr:hypothetical protein [Pyxidicoccus fallax]NMO22836.1 hypothetical protein [Pyxidicoccus fallax]NPC79941.1 hypothetical protein [Pyxidicoccus fallax]
MHPARLAALLSLSLLTWAPPAPAAGKASRPRAPLPSPSRPARLAAGYSHSCAIFTGGDLLCWGENMSGELGTGDTRFRGRKPDERLGPPVDLGPGLLPIQVAAGAGHTCALLEKGAVKCWGMNAWGQLGTGDTCARTQAEDLGTALLGVDLGPGRTARFIAAARRHTCALLDTGAVKCWGANHSGQLGLGDIQAHGDAPQEMGERLPSVPLGKGRTAVLLAVGHEHTCAVLDTGAVKCWGNNDHGQLGLGALGFRGYEPGQLGDALPSVDLGRGRTAVALSAGGRHTCAVLDTGAVKCWGDHRAGQLGAATAQGREDRGKRPGELGEHLPAVPLGKGRTAVAVAAGEAHTCALLDRGTVKCWGRNAHGQLGLGDTDTRGDTPGELGDALPAVDLGKGRTAIALAAGAEHTCALLDNATVKCWGRNDSGQLGVGSMEARGDQPGELGDKERIDLSAQWVHATRMAGDPKPPRKWDDCPPPAP